MTPRLCAPLADWSRCRVGARSAFLRAVLRETCRARPLRIGAGATEGAATFFFNGKLDEIAVYGRALGYDEIVDHYRAAIPEPSSLILVALGTLALMPMIRRRKAAEI